ncbi:MAG: PBP1A family penicillin-binding protein [Coriobacteriia bacterium]
MDDRDPYEPRRRTTGGGARGQGPRPRARRSESRSARPPAARAHRAPSRARRPARDPRRGRALRAILLAALLFAVAATIVFGAVYTSVARTLPDPTRQLKGRDQTTRILDRKGRPLAKLFADQNRTDVALKDVPVALRQAVIATEDRRFYEHRGVDPIGILRALVTDVRAGSKVQGGSTITQQYVKKAFFTDERTLRRKLAEALLAYRIEKRYGKDRILEMYLNTIYFGHGAYGVESAAQIYFGKNVRRLSLPECAMLAGVIKSPGRYSPFLDLRAAKTRRDTVLAQMLAGGVIDRPTQDRAVAAQIKTASLRHASTVAPYFVEYVKQQIIERFGDDAVFRGGLTVRTTLDIPMQLAAERAVAETLDRPDDPSAALVALDPKTGAILAMVGGRDWKRQQFNVAAQGRGRQPGSAFKPFVLVTALENGVSSEATFECGPIRIDIPGGAPWRVTGAGGGRRGPMRLREATEKSVNSVYAQLIVKVGANKVVDVAHRMGITSRLEPLPSIALGGLEDGVTPLQMADAYGTLAAGGTRATPFGVSEVRDPKGAILLSVKPKRSAAIDPAIAYLTTDILQGVIRRGTGESAAIGRPAAGKTGTTQQYRDAWFVGYVPQLVASVWVGYPDSQREMLSVHGRKVTGGSFPAHIWATFMRAALKGAPETPFERPAGLSAATICLETGLRATPFCPRTGPGLFIVSAVPGPCTVHTEPTATVVPNVIGMTKVDALAALHRLLLQVRVLEQPVAGVPAGVVAEQSPRGGSVATTRTVVTVTVSNGQSAGRPPTAAFTVTPASPTRGSPVIFDAANSTDDGRVVDWVWEFGDGEGAKGRNVSHTFAAAGSISVTLWVTDDQGQVSSVTRAIAVR